MNLHAQKNHQVAGELSKRDDVEMYSTWETISGINENIGKEKNTILFKREQSKKDTEDSK